MYRGGRPNLFARLLNRSWATLASVGLAPRRLCTLEVQGRRTGRVISFPVVVADHEGERYLVALLGERAHWVRNVRAAEGQAALRHGHREAIQLEEVDPVDRGPILRRYVSIAPGGRSHIGIDATASREAFERIAPDIPVFHITARKAANIA